MSVNREAWAAARQIDVVETAKMVRTALRNAFPAVKFRVKSSRYSGGASIDVRWVDGPTEAQVRMVTALYEGSVFDGMTDSKGYVRTLLAEEGELPEIVHFGADYVFGHRSVSGEALEDIERHIDAGVGDLVARIRGAVCLVCNRPAVFTVNDGSHSARNSGCRDHIAGLVAKGMEL